MAVYFVHRCGTCKERVVTDRKQPRYDHVGGQFGARKYDHEVTEVLTERTEESA